MRVLSSSLHWVDSLCGLIEWIHRVDSFWVQVLLYLVSSWVVVEIDLFMVWQPYIYSASNNYVQIAKATQQLYQHSKICSTFHIVHIKFPYVDKGSIVSDILPCVCHETQLPQQYTQCWLFLSIDYSTTVMEHFHTIYCEPFMQVHVLICQ